jgi:hypothetical protein
MCFCVYMCVREREGNKENVSIGNMCVCVREIGERVRERRERVSVKSGCLYMHQKCDCK